MNSDKLIQVKRPNKSQPQFQPSQPLKSQQLEAQQAQHLEIELPEQPDSVNHLKPLMNETVRDESVYGSGWSLAELRNEFSV